MRLPLSILSTARSWTVETCFVVSLVFPSVDVVDAELTSDSGASVPFDRAYSNQGSG